MPLNSLFAFNVQASLSSALDLGSAKYDMTKTYSTSFANGVAAGQADKIYTDTNVLAASAFVDLDLAGVLTDALGAPLSMARVKGLVVAAALGNTNDVVVGGAASNGLVTMFGSATDKVRVKPGMCLALFSGSADATGFVVTAGTGDLLRIANGGSGTPVTYDIVVLGASA